MILKRIIKYMLMAIVTTNVMFAVVDAHAMARKDKLFTQQKHIAQHYKISARQPIALAQASRVISPTQAMRAAMGRAPSGKVVSIRFNRQRGGYVVKIRIRGGLLKLLVNGRSGRVRMLPN